MKKKKKKGRGFHIPGTGLYILSPERAIIGQQGVIVASLL